MSTALLLLGVAAATGTVACHFPWDRTLRASGVSFLIGWLRTELALHVVTFEVLAAVGLVAAGALAQPAGVTGLVLVLLAAGAMVLFYRRGGEAAVVMADALNRSVGVEPEYHAPAVDWGKIAWPIPPRDDRVERCRDIPYATDGDRELLLDVYRLRDAAGRPTGAPVLLQIHGGAWVVGTKNEQGVPLMLHMAAQGWVAISIDYRLSPRATFPDHVVDVKRAIAWIRAHADEWGLDPDFIVITGGSAGGHLCSLAALTANDPDFQPGFEAVDTSVAGCVSFYGVYDLLDRRRSYRHRGLLAMLEKTVLKSSPEKERASWEAGSPIDRVHDGAPPFLIIHGDYDTLVPVAQAREFAGALRRVSRAEVGYAEIPSAQHAFEMFDSLRTRHVVAGVSRFLEHLRARYRRGLGDDSGERETA